MACPPGGRGAARGDLLPGVALRDRVNLADMLDGALASWRKNGGMVEVIRSMSFSNS